MKSCKTCKHFVSYHEIYDYDKFEPDDLGECHRRGIYPISNDEAGVGWDDVCVYWSPEE